MKKIIVLIMALLFIQIASAKSLTITPSVIDRQYKIGDSQLADITVTIQNNDDSAFAISLSKEGVASDFFTMSETSFYFNSTQTKTFNVIFNIPQTITPNLYSGKIRYGTDTNEYIPVYIDVKKEETGCRIMIPDEYRYSIKRTRSYKEDFTLKVSSSCTSGINILDIKTEKTYQLESEQPIRLDGAIPKGEYDGGDVVSFMIEYDVSELGKETYQSNVRINAIDKSSNADISKVLKFLITVIGDKPSQYDANITTITAYPSCSASQTSLIANNTYEVICTNVIDPNIKIKVIPDLDYLEGISVVNDEDTKQFKWKFKPKQCGETRLKISFLLFENPIGPTEEIDFFISKSQIIAGTSMKFAFFGPNGKINGCEELKGNDKLVIQMRDNATENIITDSVIYKDGERIDGISFIVEQGRTYFLSATSPSYNSIDYQCSIPNKPISISVFPFDIEVGYPITITTNPANATLYWDGNEVADYYIPSVVGIHKLRAVKSGFQETEIDVDVKNQFAFLTELPKRLKLNKENIIEVNRAVQWNVYYGETNTTNVVFASGNGAVISIRPDKKGYYKLRVKEYEWVWKVGSWGGFLKWALIVIGSLVLLVIIINFVRNRGSSTELETRFNLGDTSS